MTDNRLERERLQAEALKANLRRRKTQARAQKDADAGKADPLGPHGETTPEGGNR